MKKALVCILSLSLLLSVLTACSKENGMVTDTTPPTVTDPLVDNDRDGNDIMDDEDNDGNILDDMMPDETAPVTQSPVPDANPKGGSNTVTTP